MEKFEEYKAQALEYYAKGEELYHKLPAFADLPSLDQLIQDYRVEIFWGLVGLAAFGIAFMLLVSYITPSDFGDENADDGEPKEPLIASEHINDKKFHLLLAATGSVAAIKLPNIISALEHHDNLSIRIIVSQTASNFLKNQSEEQPSLSKISRMPNVDDLYIDADEWNPAWTRGAPILHIELRRWADLMVIAPLSADSLAKLALGLSDNLVSSVARAWDTTGQIDTPRPGMHLPYGAKRDRKGIIVAPAMNTAMWMHPVTKRHLQVLQEEWSVEKGGWVEVLAPTSKDLACGDVGTGAMREWSEIVKVIEQRLGLTKVASTRANGKA